MEFEVCFHKLVGVCNNEEPFSGINRVIPACDNLFIAVDYGLSGFETIWASINVDVHLYFLIK